jgi:large subunit ribosomal protein L22
MTGPKLNERSFVAGERTGIRASLRGSRMSASKARVVLDLIRGRDVVSADQVLQFTEREAARVVRKVLASAVANAVNNDSLEAETLYVKACYADEGPTLRRFKPRAKGRATRINKRTCHITIVLGVIEPDLLAVVQARRERAVTGRRAGRVGGVADRRARVTKSREARATKGDESTESTEIESTENDTVVDTVAETSAVETPVAENETTATPDAEETN